MNNSRKFRTFGLVTFQKTSNKPRSILKVTKLFIGINAEMEKLSDDMLLVAEHLV
jgi:hypothetical protein